MEKTIQLGDKAYRLHSSLFTIIEYKNVFSTELFNDIKKLDGSKENKEENLSGVIDTIFKIIYILNRPYNKESYEEFLRSIDFGLLTNQVELENLTNAIGEMLGTFQKSTFTGQTSKQ